MINSKIRSIAVFCGAKNEVAEEYRVIARKTGELIAKADTTLVYGGNSFGLMGELSKTARSFGGTVLGVYPRNLSKWEPLNADLDYTYIVDTMYQRKELMINKADAFIILPGGLGTLDEVFEVITLKVIKAHDKPIIFVNHNGYWNIFNDLIKYIVDHRFAASMVFDTYRFVDTPMEAFEKLGFKL